jgi:DNA modification methylase
MKVHCKYDALVKIADLKPNPKNRNQHPKPQVEQMAKVLKYQGWRESLRVNRVSGFMQNGHGRVLSASLNGWTEVPVSYQDYDDDNQAYADLIADNALAKQADLDFAGINFDLAELDGMNFDVDHLGIKDFTIEPADKYGDKDADELPEQRSTSIKRGDLFTLGTHRLLCGDSTLQSDIARLMNGEKADMVYTDPPYGLGYIGDFYQDLKPSNGLKRTINQFKQLEGDTGDWDYDPSPVLKHFEYCKDIFMWGADYYMWSLPKNGSWICWDKVGASNLDRMPGASFEMCWSKDKHKRHHITIIWRGCFGHNRKTDGDKKVHPTQKPVKLAEKFFEYWGKDKTNIVDLYPGSGSTLIACEKTNRKCFGMEIDPMYCQVIIDRWEKFTGQKAVKLDD